MVLTTSWSPGTGVNVLPSGLGAFGSAGGAFEKDTKTFLSNYDYFALHGDKTKSIDHCNQ